MKKLVSVLKRAGIAVLVLALVCNISSCGTKTLEEMVNDDKEVKQQIESMAVGGLEVAISENTVIYTYTYDQTFDKASLEAIKPEIKKIMSSTDKIFNSLIDQLEEETGIEEVSIKVSYINGDGNPIFEKEYK